jgi:hypothetical protein
MKSIAAALFCLALFGCSTSTPPTLKPTPPPDMTQRHDLAEPPDMSAESCGAIVSCLITMGTTNPTSCFSNVGATGGGEAFALIACAAQHCLQGDGGAGLGGLGGGGNQLGLLQCLSTNCQMQLSNCQGLPF